MDFAGFRVCTGKGALQDVEHFIRAENRAVFRRMAKRCAGRQTEDKLVNLITGHVNPVIDLSGSPVSPKVPCCIRVANGGGSIEGWPG